MVDYKNKLIKFIPALFVLLLLATLGMVFSRISYIPIIGNIIAEKKLNEYSINQMENIQKIKTNYDWYNGKYSATLNNGYKLSYELKNNAIHDEEADLLVNKKANVDYKLIRERFTENLEFPEDIIVWTLINADDYTKRYQRLYLLSIYNDDNIMESESLKMPANIAQDFIKYMGSGYNFTGIQIIYADKNGMYQIAIPTETLKPIQEKELLENIVKFSKEELPLDYLEWLKNQQGEEPSRDIMREFNVLVQEKEEIMPVIKFINENISLVSSKDASIMVDELEEMQNRKLTDLIYSFDLNQDLQAKLNVMYEDGLDINKIENIKDQDIKNVLIELKEKGYKIESTEAMHFPVIDYEFYKSYASYVTADRKEYIDIMTIESNEAPAKDAALVIGWEKIIERTLKQEKFLNLYRVSSRKENIEWLYDKYVYFTFYGLNNTPLFDFNSKIIKEDAKVIYLEAIKDIKDSQYLNNLKGFMDLLKESDYRLTKEIEEYREHVVGSVG